MISIYQKFKETIKELSKKAEINWVKNNYTPLNGVGVKGTWNINVTGNAGSADVVSWDGIENKPTSFAPASHNHDSFYPSKTGDGASGTWNINISGKATTAGTADSAKAVAWGNVSGKPTSFTPASHNHDSSYPSKTGAGASGTWNINISGNSASASSVEWNNVKNKPSTYNPASHNHAWNQITSKPTNILCTVSYSNGILKIKNV